MNDLEKFGRAEAKLIGDDFRRARRYAVHSIIELRGAGQVLIEMKKQVDHGDWLPWLQAQRGRLGFGERTAQALMKLANTQLASHLTPEEALQLSREVWGHSRKELAPASPKLMADVEVLPPVEPEPPKVKDSTFEDRYRRLRAAMQSIFCQLPPEQQEFEIRKAVELALKEFC